ncbi:VCBS repeat-containing protein [Rhodonellum sp.]|uniref:VCBS repeat-containing protein n=1 Tax=Rhodonellum sp. TaxID=2231180 RepID=UPI002722153F|nr:VCBS repeat-containing protein [Rhodonellum sp.]MDO9554393.1 VCBS repeat-containing protein [Rhodonellum sp.]
MCDFTSRVCLTVLIMVLVISCDPPTSEEKVVTLPVDQPLFNLVSPENSGVHFNNLLTETLNTNVLVYEYFYNGGGVAVGDLNGDGLDDLYFTGNMVPNQLYLNKGNLKFEDITDLAGVAGRNGPWTTGVTMADVNGDGRLDIYVCYSGNMPSEKRKNQLFINNGPNENGTPTFSEEAAAYGLAIDSYSTQALFFDYDKDGDLDMFLLNHNPKSLPILDESSTAEVLKYKDPSGSQLFRNDNGKFVEVTEKAGIQNSALSYGLGVGVADLNGDDWPDIYISNDYTAPDFLYINNKNGTFTDVSKSALGHISQFSMGNDLADINNDGLVDIYTLDMLPESNKRQKLLMAPDNYEKFDFMVNVGFHHQYMRNMLHLNNGDGSFSEIGQLAGVSNTDWSWAALFADYDNDGLKDLLVTNGYNRDYTNMDFLKYMGDFVQHQSNLKREDILGLVSKIPASDIGNYVFKNKDGLQFENVTDKWGLKPIANSNGAAYADLDNDGDLDLIINNVNEKGFVYENLSNTKENNHFLKIKLEGAKQNTSGLGAKVMLYHDGITQMIEQMPTRGYQSSVSPILHFGLGASQKVDSLKVRWLGGDEQTLFSTTANQLLVLKESEAKKGGLSTKKANAPLFKKSTLAPFSLPNPYSGINDFKRQPLMISPISGTRSAMAKGELKEVGSNAVYIGGLAGIAGQLFVQKPNKDFMALPKLEWTEKYRGSEDTDALFFDANGDGFPDLYVASGGYGNFLPEDPLLQDRLYLNDGKGGWLDGTENLPKMPTSTSVVAAADINGDGFLDLFVGSRVVPGRYPEIPTSYILINDGMGNFTDQTDKFSKELKHIGMVTDAAWIDLNGDNLLDLVVVGEWMPITVFINTGEKLEERTFDFFDRNYSGWWNTLTVEDLNGDGRPDLLVGNHGTNSQVKASFEQPAELYAKDFDQNGSMDPIFNFYIQDKKYPYLTRDELFDQFASKRNKFLTYESFSEAQMEDIFSPEELDGAQVLEANFLKTAFFTLESNAKFKLQELPVQVQFAPVYAIEWIPAQNGKEGHLIFAGNAETARLRLGKSDANYGVVLKVNEKGEMEYLPQPISGLGLRGDVRNILTLGEGKSLFYINKEGISVYEMQK